MQLNQFKWGMKQKGINYEYDLPADINHPWKWEHPQLNTLLEEASIKLGELNSFAKACTEY